MTPAYGRKLSQFNNKPGIIFLPLLLILAISGFILVRTLANNSFSNAQSDIENGIQDRYDPYSSKYSLSRHMGSINTWITFTNERFNYKITHPKVWNKLKSRAYPGAEDLYEAALASNINLSVAVQKIFVEPKNADKIKTLEGDYNIFENSPENISAYIKKNDIYYIVRLNQIDYFGSEKEFRGAFGNIIKRIEFLD